MPRSCHKELYGLSICKSRSELSKLESKNMSNFIGTYSSSNFIPIKIRQRKFEILSKLKRKIIKVS